MSEDQKLDDAIREIIASGEEAMKRKQEEFQTRLQPLRDTGMTDPQLAAAVEFAKLYLDDVNKSFDTTMKDTFTRLGMEWSKDRKRWVWPPKFRGRGERQPS